MDFAEWAKEQAKRMDWHGTLYPTGEMFCAYHMMIFFEQSVSRLNIRVINVIGPGIYLIR